MLFSHHFSVQFEYEKVPTQQVTTLLAVVHANERNNCQHCCGSMQTGATLLSNNTQHCSGSARVFGYTVSLAF